MEAAVTPIGARHAHDELMDTPVIDKGFYTVCGSNLLFYQLIQEGREEDLRHAVAWLLNAAKAYTIKLVNIGEGVAFLCSEAGRYITGCVLPYIFTGQGAT